LGLALVGAIADRHPGDFAWGRYPTAANPSGADHLARLVGRRDVGARLVALQGAARGAAVAEWVGVPGWGARVGPVLVYGRGGGGEAAGRRSGSAWHHCVCQIFNRMEALHLLDGSNMSVARVSVPAPSFTHKLQCHLQHGIHVSRQQKACSGLGEPARVLR
jgi:hypothetical protein